jgi:hypothetical protein
MIILAAIRVNGVIYTGKCHAYIMWSLPKEFDLSDQGFVNDKNEFLDRFKAAEEAIACGQIIEMKYPSMGFK